MVSVLVTFISYGGGVFQLWVSWLIMFHGVSHIEAIKAKQPAGVGSGCGSEIQNANVSNEEFISTWNSWSSFFSIQSVTWARVTSLSPSFGRAFSSRWGGVLKPYLQQKRSKQKMIHSQRYEVKELCRKASRSALHLLDFKGWWQEHCSKLTHWYHVKLDDISLCKQSGTLTSHLKTSGENSFSGQIFSDTLDKNIYHVLNVLLSK